MLRLFFRNSKKIISKINLAFYSESAKLPNSIRREHEYELEEFYDLCVKTTAVWDQNDISRVFKEHGHELNDKLLNTVIREVVYKRIDLDEDFNKDIAPIISHYISLMDKD